MLDFIKEIFYTFVNYLLALFTKISEDEHRKEIVGSQLNIIIIRGFGKKPSLPEIRIEQKMRMNNVGGVFAGVSPIKDSLDSYIPQLEKEIIKYDKGIVLVGLSLGGLVALRYIYKKGWNKILGVITAGSPLNGIKFITYSSQKKGMVGDLKTDSIKLKQIRQLKASTGKITHIFAKWDQFTGDPNQINTTGKKIILQMGGHNNLLYNPELSSIIIKIAKTYNNINT